jgi:hypothetical protein
LLTPSSGQDAAGLSENLVKEMAESVVLSFSFCIKINRWYNKISLLQGVSNYEKL